MYIVEFYYIHGGLSTSYLQNYPHLLGVSEGLDGFLVENHEILT